MDTYEMLDRAWDDLTPNEKAQIRNVQTIKPGMTYTGHHIPSGENWLILGIDVKRGKVCAAGWPATIGELSDIKDLKERAPRTEKEYMHVSKYFGTSFFN